MWELYGYFLEDSKHVLIKIHQYQAQSIYNINMSIVYDVIIVGAGPAGMMAAISAKRGGNDVLLLEKNSSPGVKLLLTGKGRCNLTTTREVPDIIEAFGKNGKFLYGSLSRFSNEDVLEFFETRGIGLKVERGQRVFPKSDKSTDILRCLTKELGNKRVRVLYNILVKSIKKDHDIFEVVAKGDTYKTNNVIIATGGMSYPHTGSSGDGYKFAKELGHKIISPIPALTPLISNDKNIPSISGLSLKNVEISFSTNENVFAKEFGEMLFTHKGISGPIVLKCSRQVYEHLNLGEIVKCKIDLKPRLSKKVLKERIVREIKEAPKKEYKSLLEKLLPKSLVSYAANLTQIDIHKQGSTLTSRQMGSLINFLKDFQITIERVESIKRAIVTHGGVDIKEIDPKTMQSKIVEGLYFAGEIICLDGPTGGYNLTKAFSTGHVAGQFSTFD
ncbi:NAD(P)/FAD-dependent oxidoreductase [Patescibacteria group bacterium]